MRSVQESLGASTNLQQTHWESCLGQVFLVSSCYPLGDHVDASRWVDRLWVFLLRFFWTMLSTKRADLLADEDL